MGMAGCKARAQWPVGRSHSPMTHSHLLADSPFSVLAQDYFITLVDNFGPLGVLAYMAVYIALEVLAGESGREGSGSRETELTGPA